MAFEKRRKSIEFGREKFLIDFSSEVEAMRPGEVRIIGHWPHKFIVRYHTDGELTIIDLKI